ncbi:MAG: succinate dehydrogenase, cytochrome b556 subunit [Pseudomonadota bacterium]
MNTRQRPLSPHLSAYKFRITSTLSILHRLTGVALTAGTLLLVAWLIGAASGPEAYASVAGFAGSIVGRLMIAGWTYAFFYHLCNGIRHLFWDAGRGFEIEQATASGWLVVTVSSFATLAALAALYL